MGKTSAAAKNKWNTANCKQIKVCAPPDIASMFKAVCKNGNVSMSGEIIGFMKKRSGIDTGAPRKKDLLETRAGRRKRMNAIIRELELIKDAEQAYLDNIPESFQCSARYDAAEECVAVIEEAIGSLSGAF